MSAPGGGADLGVVREVPRGGGKYSMVAIPKCLLRCRRPAVAAPSATRRNLAALRGFSENNIHVIKLLPIFNPIIWSKIFNMEIYEMLCLAQVELQKIQCLT